MNNVHLLDDFKLPPNVTDADAEYLRICISRCNNKESVDKYRHLLDQVNHLLVLRHAELKRKHNVKKSI